MKNYFHCKTEIYLRRRRTIIILTVVPLFQVCVIVMLIMQLTFRSLSDRDYLYPLLIVIAACVLLSMLISWFVFEKTEKAIKRNSRYTYFEIDRKVLIFSRYAGEFAVRGIRTTNRILYVIPLKTLQSAELTPKKRSLTLKGVIREYSGDSTTLGYHIKRGNIDFDRWWLNDNGFTEKNELLIPPLFGSRNYLLKMIRLSKKQFDNTPPPKPYKFTEAAFVRRRSKPRPMPEGMSFERKW